MTSSEIYRPTHCVTKSARVYHITPVMMSKGPKEAFHSRDKLELLKYTHIHTYKNCVKYPPSCPHNVEPTQNDNVSI